MLGLWLCFSLKNKHAMASSVRRLGFGACMMDTADACFDSKYGPLQKPTVLLGWIHLARQVLLYTEQVFAERECAQQCSYLPYSLPTFVDAWENIIMVYLLALLASIIARYNLLTKFVKWLFSEVIIFLTSEITSWGNAT